MEPTRVGLLASISRKFKAWPVVDMCYEHASLLQVNIRYHSKI